jgi:cardiolipin synthase
MALAPVFLALVLGRRMRWAAAVFVLAGITDLLDGLIARLGHQQTVLGAMLDPIADKLLLASAYVALTWGPGLRHPIPAWLTVIVLSRDAIIVVSVSAINLAFGRRVYYPSRLGKVCTFFQLVTAGTALLVDAVDIDLPGLEALFHATLVLTVASALHYVYLASMRRSGQAP